MGAPVRSWLCCSVILPVLGRQASHGHQMAVKSSPSRARTSSNLAKCYFGISWPTELLRRTDACVAQVRRDGELKSLMNYLRCDEDQELRLQPL